MNAKTIVFAIILLIQGVFSCEIKAQTEDETHGYLIKIGDRAPDFATTLDNGTLLKLSDQVGKVVMIQFTASWCGVCRKEMPFIESEIWQVLKNKDFVLIGIDRDEPIEKVKEFAQQTQITYPLGLDPEAEIFSKFAQKDAGVTRNVIVDRQGKIIYLTRLFNRKEFDAMKKVIIEEVSKN